ncbi:competence protein ComEA [Microcella putealis]|uniref:Competence protein ComEA n=1 Tax=Microcella putealis TaxID=337005 RepID=A0A4Q7LWY6_9MICO|nr:competence protein ComEA [Microcella putealis]TQM24099.1 competence protein ComEA [Microcella putealis]
MARPCRGVRGALPPACTPYRRGVLPDDTPPAAEPPRRALRLRAAVGGVVVLVLLGLGAAVITSIVTPGGERITVSANDPGAPGSGETRVDADAGGAGTGGAHPDDGASVVEARVVLVHVAGAVANPGVVELAEGARVLDAVARAGGAADDAELTAVNLARVVVDGEQIVVPRVGEVPAAAPGSPASGAASSGAAGLVNLNVADATTLETLPGVGPAIAARIIAWRDENGPFRSVDELLAVSGIGEKTLDGFRELVTV